MRSALTGVTRGGPLCAGQEPLADYAPLIMEWVPFSRALSGARGRGRPNVALAPD